MNKFLRPFFYTILFIFLCSCNSYSESEKTEIDSDIKLFLADSISSFMKSESGMYYKVVNQGDGQAIKNQDLLKLNLYGKILDNDSVFLDKKKSKPIFKNQLIMGIQEGLSYINNRGEIFLVIPAYLGYGKQSISGIKENSNLLYRIKILEVLD